jgi:hypothetical protein
MKNGRGAGLLAIGAFLYPQNLLAIGAFLYPQNPHQDPRTHQSILLFFIFPVNKDAAAALSLYDLQ